VDFLQILAKLNGLLEGEANELVAQFLDVCCEIGHFSNLPDGKPALKRQ